MVTPAANGPDPEATNATRLAKPQGLDSQGTLLATPPGQPISTDSLATHKLDPQATIAAPAPVPGMPAEIGGVRLVRLLGKGGMGEVFLGRHLAFDIDVAVKFLRPGVDESERFLQEARVAVRVLHPNVVRVFNAGSEGGRIFLVMELVTGGDVAQLVRREGRLPVARALALAIQAADGLAAAHAVGIVHRDVKPANFMLTADGLLKIADLGLAKSQTCDAELTRTGMIMGTPAYMSPEQAVDTRTAGPAADVYSLGVSLFHLLTGKLPFTGDTTTKVLLAHLNDPIPDVRTLSPEVPVAVADAITRMLSKDPTTRPVDGAAAAALLRAASSPAGGATAADPVRRDLARPAPTAGRMWLVVGAVIAIAIIAVVMTTRKLEAPGQAGTPPPTATGPAAPAPAAGAPAIVVTAPAAAPAADPWQSPPRAVFVIDEGLPPAAAAAIEGAVIDAKLKLVERTRIEQLIKEQDLASAGRVTTASAVRLGRLVGGHLALFAQGDAAQVQLRAVVVESGEIAGSASDPTASASTRALAMIEQALAGLDAQGRLGKHGDSHSISLGRQHGVRVGDSFRILDGTPDAPGATVGVAKVTQLGDTTATVTVTLTAAGSSLTLPALVQRVERNAP